MLQLILNTEAYWEADWSWFSANSPLCPVTSKWCTMRILDSRFSLYFTSNKTSKEITNRARQTEWHISVIDAHKSDEMSPYMYLSSWEEDKDLTDNRKTDKPSNTVFECFRYTSTVYVPMLCYWLKLSLRYPEIGSSKINNSRKFVTE